MTKIRKLLITIFIMSIILAAEILSYNYIYLPSRVVDTMAQASGSTDNAEDISTSTTTEATIEEVAPIDITLTGIGDIMMHKWQMERGYDSATDTFDLSDTFTYITPYLESSNYTVGNLETVFAGKGNGSADTFHGYSCFPAFNAPESFAGDIENAGVDLLGTANNHSIDSYVKGVYTSLDYIDAVGLEHVGTARTLMEQQEQTIVDIDGIKVGFVSYTYDLNGNVLPSDSAFAVNTLDNYSEEKISTMCMEIGNLKSAGADIVVAILHLGTEYSSVPDSYQTAVIDKAVDSGADIIYGSHPHVVQPMEIKKVKDDAGKERTAVVFYSLGNFVSSQVYKDGVMKDIGLIADVDITKDNSGTYITGVRVAPVYTYWNSEVIGVVPVIEAYENQDKYSFLRPKDWPRISDAYDKTINTVTNNGEIPYHIENYKYVIDMK